MIPEPIEYEKETNEGFIRDKSSEQLLGELIEKFNILVIYLASISERL